jgi:hypothetical protein
MRNLLLSGMILLLAFGVRAQVVVNLQLPPLGLTIKPQLWNLSLVNTSGQAMYVRVEMTMTSVTNNQRVLTGTSKLLLLPKGARQLQVADVSPITYNAGSAGYSIDPSPDGFLPIGVFNVCYSVMQVISDGSERISEECETLEIEPISPPQLILPLDEEQVDITRPFFAWIPPSPYNTLNGLLYDWTLVEVQPTQSAGDAIQQNVPVLSRQNLSFTGFQYPLSSPELDTSKLYAWRITAKNSMAPVGNSEVWSFRVRKYQPDTTRSVGTGYFARLHREEDAAFIISAGILRFEYQNDLNSASIRLRLFDVSSAGRKAVSLDSASKQVRLGQNFVQVDLRQQSGMVHKHMYLLEVVNARQEKHYLKFEYRKEEE